jgi:Holliday junction resolvase
MPKKINSRQKGCRGERLWRDVLREEGFTARRGQQFSGGTESPDVICDELKSLHMEVKFVERLNLEQACEQADRDRGVKPYIVAHKKSRSGWKVTMEASLFFALLRDGMDVLRHEWMSEL